MPDSIVNAYEESDVLDPRTDAERPSVPPVIKPVDLGPARFINELLGVDEKIAEKDACRIEHIISPETFAGIKGMLKD